MAEKRHVAWFPFPAIGRISPGLLCLYQVTSLHLGCGKQHCDAHCACERISVGRMPLLGLQGALLPVGLLGPELCSSSGLSRLRF